MEMVLYGEKAIFTTQIAKHKLHPPLRNQSSNSAGSHAGPAKHEEKMIWCSLSLWPSIPA